MLGNDLKFVIRRYVDDIDHRFVNNVAKRPSELSRRALGEIDTNERHGDILLIGRVLKNGWHATVFSPIHICHRFNVCHE
jgi:hypothetical protein